MRTVRRAGFRSADSDDSPGAETKTPFDPAVAVAEQMLSRAFTAVADAHLPIGSPGWVTIVHTPSGDWTEVLHEAWRNVVHDGANGADGDDTRWWGTETWIAFVRPEETLAREGRRSADEVVALALGRGMAVTGF